MYIDKESVGVGACFSRNLLEGAKGGIPKPFNPNPMAPLNLCVSVCLKLVAYLVSMFVRGYHCNRRSFQHIDEVENKANI